MGSLIAFQTQISFLMEAESCNIRGEYKQRERERERERERAWNSSFSKRTSGKVCEELGQRRRSYIVWWFLAMAELPVSKKYILIFSLHQQLPGQTADLGCTTFQAAQFFFFFFFFFCFCCFCKLSLDLSATWFSTLNSSVPPPPQNIHFCILDTAGAFLLLDHHESRNSNLMWWSMQLCSPHFHDQCRRSSISYSKPKDHPNLSTVPISQLLMYVLSTYLLPG